MSLKRILPIAAVEVFVWAMMLLCTLLISRVAFGITIGTEALVDRVLTQVARLLVSGAIVLVWLFVWKKTMDHYFWRTIKHSKTT
jgi:glucan phosphoethanolaminetransferase (alkaline phosphatase superfamily)